MASLVATIVLCAAIPVFFSCCGKTGVSTTTSAAVGATAQSVHWRRRIQHAACGLTIAFGYKWVVTEAWTAVAVLAFFSTCFLALHQVRRRMKGVNDLYLRLVGPLLRPHELNGLPGAFWFLVGAATAIALFRRNIALQSILHVSVGDPAASVVGIKMGGGNRLLPGGKSLAGSLAALMACAMSTMLLFGFCRNEELDFVVDDDARLDEFCHGCMIATGGNDSESDWYIADNLFRALQRCASSRSVIVYSALGGISGAVGEVIPLGVDDNFSMPLVSGVVSLTLYWLYGGR